MAKSIEAQLEAILDDYSKEVREILDEEIEKTSDDLVADLKRDSPKKTGKYAKSWTSKQTVTETNKKVKTVYNEKGQLTHLLEHGHMTRNGKTRTKAFPHILKNEEKANALLLKRISERLEKWNL